jgi:hypothetical protein
VPIWGQKVDRLSRSSKSPLNSNTSANLRNENRLAGQLTAWPVPHLAPEMPIEYRNLGGCGTLYLIDPNGAESVVHSFDETNGWDPIGIAANAAGDVYGATLLGGVVVPESIGLNTHFSFQPSFGEAPIVLN